MLEIGVLGPLTVALDGRIVGDLTPMLRRLLVLLLSHPGTAHSANVIAEELWQGSPPRTARKTLAVYVHRLRKALGGDDRIVFSPHGYAIAVADGEVDMVRFQAGVHGGERPDGTAALTAYAEMLELWRGEPFAGYRDMPMVARVAERLLEAYGELVERRFRTELDLGRAEAVAGSIQDAIADHPYREGLRELLMLALYRTGRLADAVDVYRRTHRLMSEELGLAPGPRLRSLHQRMIAGDRTLLRASGPPARRGGWRTSAFAGRAAMVAGDLDRAHRSLREALDAASSAGDHLAMAEVLRDLADVHEARYRRDRAMAGAATTLQPAGPRIPPLTG